MKIGILENSNHRCAFDAAQCLKAFSRESGGDAIKMCQQLEMLPISASQCFPDDPNATLQNPAQDQFEVENGQTCFNRIPNSRRCGFSSHMRLPFRGCWLLGVGKGTVT